jgi:two-component system heavy metal sensor histidine kinase CusS
MTLVGRLTWGMSLLTLLTIGASFAAISVILDRYQERQLDEALLDVARTEAEEAPRQSFSFSARPGPIANDIGPLDKYGVIYDPTGHALTVTHPFDQSAPALSALPGKLNVCFDFVFGVYRLRGVVVPIPGYPNHRLLLAASREDLDGDSRFLRTAMGIALVLALAWMVGAIAWLVRRTTAEHKRVAQILHRIALGDVGARVAGVSGAELQQLGSDIDEIAGRLGKFVEQQRRFITNAAHELRSPLAALYGELQQSLRRERGTEEYRQSLSHALRATRRLKDLADDLLDLARVEPAGALPEPVLVEAAVADAIDSIASLASERGITTRCALEGCEVVAYPGAVARILRSILENAIRFSPPGGVIRVDAQIGHEVSIFVRDEGPGVPAAEADQIFEPFYRSPGARAAGHDGAGLGLAIARELARKNGGEVETRDEGTGCFVVRLPAWARRLEIVRPTGAAGE